MRTLKTILLLGLLGGSGAFAFIYSGVYQIGADVPHNKLVYWALETLREKSIARAAQDIPAPPLDDPELLLAGGPDYNEMCAVCHLKPGMTQTDMSLGLYPSPPDLTSHQDDGAPGHGGSEEAARRMFWIIKHGIKASGMPAWGPTHDDQRIWAMVAFLQKLPQLTPTQYQILTARSPGSGNHNAHNPKVDMIETETNQEQESDSQ